jgi:hypothetical protein
MGLNPTACPKPPTVFARFSIAAEFSGKVQTMTKEEFLRDPIRYFWSEHVDVPIEWIKDAWTVDKFRENAIYELIRSVRKNGDFFIAQYLLTILSEVLREQQVVALFTAIRDRCHRTEDEWRGKFEAAFRKLADKLPPQGKK